MFRTHQPYTPANNLFLQRRWDILQHEQHLHRVRNVKAETDTNPPRTYMHMHLKPKKIQAEQDRLSQIHRDNQCLLEKIGAVMRGSGSFDNHNYYEPKSLNRWKRQDEMVHLAYGNQIQLRRILDTHPEYNHNKFEDEFTIHQKYKANILKYPPNWRELLKEEQRLRLEIRRSLMGKPWKPKSPPRVVELKDEEESDFPVVDETESTESDERPTIEIDTPFPRQKKKYSFHRAQM